ncbi:MAG: AAA family ATPase [Bacteroidales bacterium]|nr:AAA family ATPase [Bacteroidales bacterium]
MQNLVLAYNRNIDETDCGFVRYLHKSVDWSERLIGIKGSRGVGKTTMLLQHIKTAFHDRTQAFYVSLDNLWFSNHTLSELTEYLYTHGVTHLFLDEVHRYAHWVRELKNIYDSYPKLHIIFTGSSLLELDNAQADLSRRVRMYHLYGLSFREYLEMNGVAQLPVLTLDELLAKHVARAAELTSKTKVLPHFERYIQCGYYPFFAETATKESYAERLQRIIVTIIENDIPAVESIEYETLSKTKSLLMMLAQMVPFTLNITSMCEKLAITRNQLIRLMTLLERASLIRQLRSDGKGLKAIGKPAKLLFDNPNVMHALNNTVDIGTQRETFFAMTLAQAHKLKQPKQGDLLVDDKYLFEVGGKDKGFGQIRDIDNSYVVADDIEVGFGNKIPLWLFGFLY